jgi:radical SAM-linked protein
MIRQRLRIRFSKLGRLKFIGHKDMLRTLEALFRRVRLPLAMSNGFHPKVKMSFPTALALGYESIDEVLELEMNESAELLDTEVLLGNLNRHSLEGLTFLSARQLGEGEKKASLASSVFQMTVPPALQNQKIKSRQAGSRPSILPAARNAARVRTSTPVLLFP